MHLQEEEKLEIEENCITKYFYPRFQIPGTGIQKEKRRKVKKTIYSYIHISAPDLVQFKEKEIIILEIIFKHIFKETIRATSLPWMTNGAH